jgi:hypothetical protein
MRVCLQVDMNADPFDVEAQRRIEERIKQASSEESVRLPLEGLSDLSTACFLFMHKIQNHRCGIF